MLRPVARVMRWEWWCGQYLAYLKRRERISAGPFAGMRFPAESLCSAAAPKLLGTYEVELHRVFRGWSEIPFRQIVDVGAAEGYYAIGAALTWKTARVVAFEMEEAGRDVMLHYSRLNGVAQRIDIRGYCSVEDLRNELKEGGPSLIVMDVEGEEYSLLDPNCCPALRNFHVVVELHDWVRRDVAELLTARFTKSHAMETILSRPRFVSDLCVPRCRLLRRRFAPMLLSAANEHRPGIMTWLVMTPRPAAERCGA